MFDEADRTAALAWWINAIHVKTRHDKRLPALESLLVKRGRDAMPEPRQSTRGMRAAMISFAEAWNAQQDKIKKREARSRGG